MRIFLKIFAYVGLFSAFACQGGQERQKNPGGGMDYATPSSIDAVPNSPSQPTDKEPVKGGTSTSDTSVPKSKTLEQCTAEKKAWIAVVDSGNKPATCGEALVSWCCTKEEIYQRFPTAASLLEAEFDKYETKDGVKLYHCSRDAANKTTFHMGAIKGAKTVYRYLYIEKIFETEPDEPVTDCPAVTTDDLVES